jgi:NAD(P)H-hydrate epimerase
VTLGFWKKGLVTGQAADYVGRVRLSPLQIPRDLPIEAEALLYTDEDARRLPERRPAGHKGDYGHVYLWSGPSEKQGAAALSARASLRTGAGLVTLLGLEEDLNAIRPRLPSEIMTEIYRPDFFTRKKGQVGAFGPGMGTDEIRRKVLVSALESDWSLVLDADALTIIAGMGEEGEELLRSRAAHTTIMTPHPKEASRLLKWEVNEVERDRYASCREIADRYQAFVLLKGKGTLIGGVGRPIIVVTAGDSGLSKGGTGDTLTGIIASLLAQHVPADRATPLASFIHGRASELLTQYYGQERSTLASEVADKIPEVLKEIEWAKWKRS